MVARTRPFWRWTIAALLALAVAAFAGRDSAEAGFLPPPIFADYDLTLSVDQTGGVKDGCASGTSDDVCLVHPGQTFTVDILLTGLSGMPDSNTNGDHGYVVFGPAMHYSAGLVWVDRANECAPLPDVDHQTEDGTTGAPGENRLYYTSCWATGEWTQEGLVAQVDFACPASETLEVITHVATDMFLSADNGAQAYNLQPTESLVIDCRFVFPWDVDDSGQVSVADIAEVVQHFGEVEPTP